MDEGVNGIPYHLVHLTGQERVYLDEVLFTRELGGSGKFTALCENWLQAHLGVSRAHLTPSCTGALEMAALLCDIGPGDEVIMPSFTYVSTANAFVLRGATPVFVDICPERLTLDPDCVKAAITSKTRAIVPVHYAGTACDMEALGQIAAAHGLWLIEDAAHALLSRTSQGKFLGAGGQLGCLSFHSTKNVTAGGGGALLVNDQTLMERAQCIWHRGTDKAAFDNGQVSHYRWIERGSAYQPGELTAAFLWAQLERAQAITARRMELHAYYLASLALLVDKGLINFPKGNYLTGNAHLIYVVAISRSARDALMAALALKGIHSVPHYVPLHSSPAGLRWGRAHGSMHVTDYVANGLLRLPLYPDLQYADIDRVTSVLRANA